MSADSDILLVPYGDDPLPRLASVLIDRTQAGLPDLSNHIVLLPDAVVAPRFRKLLLEIARTRGCSALLPPFVGTFAVWARQFSIEAGRTLSQTAREVLLLQALQQHPGLYGETPPWPLIDSLLTLFDELAANGRTLPDDPKALERVLAAGYGISDQIPQPLSNEARLLHVLWQAWQEHLRDRGLQDPAVMRANQLQQSLSLLPHDALVCLAGFTEFSEGETRWLRALRERDQLLLVFHGQAGGSEYHPDAPLSQLLQALGNTPADIPSTPVNAVINEAFRLSDIDLRTRAESIAKVYPKSPLEDRLKIMVAADAETEARAVEIQVRRWWLQGKRNIGVITNDRKLARRVRALLERTRLILHDGAGWPLSTTSAATALMQWLDVIEQNCSRTPLFALLKSPFTFGSIDLETRRLALAHFETDIVWPQRITAGLARYRTALRRRRSGFDERRGSATADLIETMLGHVERASSALIALDPSKSVRAVEFLDGVKMSLDALEMSEAYANDPAGQEILAELDAMREGVRALPVLLTWREFRAWLAHNIERRRFRPALRGAGVELMSFAESRLYRFDALVIAGAHEEQLPGSSHGGFFNEGVRRELALRTNLDRRCRLFYDFRRLLESGEQVLITARRENGGEPVLLSPWVERLRSFHRLAYGHALAPQTLPHLIDSPLTLISAQTARPGPVDYPRVRARPELFDSTVSASAHQRMIDCPYQYFALDGLRLVPHEELPDMMGKSDYGKYVHRILQAFHAGVQNLPGPFDEPVSESNAARAAALLDAIAAAVFAPEIAKNPLAVAWYYRWRQLIPAYVRWQERRAQDWQLLACEQERSQALHEELVLKGRIDRIDRGHEGLGIVDYKTGAVPDAETILRGENVQLPLYAALLAEPVSEAAFLAFGQETVSSKAAIEGAALQDLREQVVERMIAVQTAVCAGDELPAWGDSETCEYCPAEGLCRKELWREGPPND